MKTIAVVMLCMTALVASSTAGAGSWSDTIKNYQCIEIEKFAVDRSDFSNKEMERAAAIPEKTLDSLQHKIVGEITRDKVFDKVTKPDAGPCGAKALVFGGKVTDYKEGSRAARMFIGLGAGKQKFEVQCYIKDKSSGEVLAKKEVIDRKFGGIAGGDEAKGESDFAEKVVNFVKSGN